MRTLGSALLDLWPSYVAHVVSFLVIGAIWINHHAQFRYIVRADGVLVLLNVLQLMLIAFLPFPTAVLAEAFFQGVEERVAAAFYGGPLTVLGILVNLMWRYAARDARLLDDRVSRSEAGRIGRRYLLGPTIYGLATAVALVSPQAAVALFVLANIFYLWPRRRIG